MLTPLDRNGMVPSSDCNGMVALDGNEMEGLPGSNASLSQNGYGKNKILLKITDKFIFNFFIIYIYI